MAASALHGMLAQSAGAMGVRRMLLTVALYRYRDHHRDATMQMLAILPRA